MFICICLCRWVFECEKIKRDVWRESAAGREVQAELSRHVAEC